MAGFTRFEDIKVWQEGRELVKAVYALTKTGLFCKDFGMRNQLQRAAVTYKFITSLKSTPIASERYK